MIGAHVRVSGTDAGLDSAFWYIGQLLDQLSPRRWSVLVGGCADNVEVLSDGLIRILWDMDEPGVFWGGSLCQSYQLSLQLQQIAVCRVVDLDGGLDLSVVTHPDGCEGDAWLDDLDDGAFRAEMERMGIPLSG